MNENPIKESPKSSYWEPALALFAKVTGWVALPVIGALFLGRFLDEKFGTKPWVFLGLTFLAFIVSMIAIIQYSLDYIKEIEKNKKNESPKSGR